MLGADSEAAADDHLHQQMIGAVRDSDAHSEIEFPVGTEIQVDRRHDLLRLGPEADRSPSPGPALRSIRSPR